MPSRGWEALQLSVQARWVHSLIMDCTYGASTPGASPGVGWEAAALEDLVALDRSCSYARVVSPPPQPSVSMVQLVSCWTLSPHMACPASIIHCDSICSAAEWAQHEPHCPWFFTGVTYPASVQSTRRGATPLAAAASFHQGTSPGEVPLGCPGEPALLEGSYVMCSQPSGMKPCPARPLKSQSNSSWDLSENLVTPNAGPPPDSSCSALYRSARTKFSEKIAKRFASSARVGYDLRYALLKLAHSERASKGCVIIQP
mmetsp:Transcript_26353/g.58984  ORF Transcript_26353/g.58984 Transcript_26353/m.58984 type:complete len:258 (+) Transcript_26353:589-1362(+)